MAKYAETWLYPDGNGPAYLELIDFTPSSKSGLLIPKPAAMWVPWLENPDRQQIVLELAEAGRVIGHPIEHLDQRLIGTINEAMADLSEGADLEEARTKLIAIGERFIRAKIDASRSLYLNSRLLHHLCLRYDEAARIFFIAVASTFEIWTIDYYEKVRQSLARRIRDCCTDLRT